MLARDVEQSASRDAMLLRSGARVGRCLPREALYVRVMSNVQESGSYKSSKVRFLSSF